MCCFIPSYTKSFVNLLVNCQDPWSISLGSVLKTSVLSRKYISSWFVDRPSKTSIRLLNLWVCYVGPGTIGLKVKSSDH